MLDNSDYCIFYYNTNYKPKPRKQSKRDITCFNQNHELVLPINMQAKEKK